MLDAFKGSELEAKDFVGPCMVAEVSVSAVVVGGAATALMLGMDLGSLQDGATFLVDALSAQAGGGPVAENLVSRMLGLQYTAKALVNMAGLNASTGSGFGITAGAGFLWRSGEKPPGPPEIVTGPEKLVYRFIKI